MEDSPQQGYGYGKRPLWQWVVIYLIIGGIVYGLVYYFVFARKGGYSASDFQPQTPSQNTGLY